MQSLILHPTSIAQWHALLNEAQKSSTIYLKEDLEAYLVFLLMRFTSQPEIASSVLGLDFLKCHQYRDAEQSHLLKDLGDRCLLFAGLFPGRAIKRRVKLSYFIKLGQRAYSTLSNQINEQESLFIQLCFEFPRLMDVLHATRESNHTSDLLQSLELWHETGSEFAWKRICHATQGLPIICSDKSH